jgi:hypothetical protein
MLQYISNLQHQQISTWSSISIPSTSLAVFTAGRGERSFWAPQFTIRCTGDLVVFLCLNMSLHYCVLFLLLIFRCKNLSLDITVCRKLQTTFLTAVIQSQIYPDLFSLRVQLLRLQQQSHSPRSRSHLLPHLSTCRSSPDLHNHSHASCRYSFFLFFKQILLPLQ